MKRIILLVVYLVFPFSLILSQITQDGFPKSSLSTQLKSTKEINSREIKALNIKNFLDEDAKETIKNRYSIYKKVSIDIKRKGTLTTTEEGKIWQYQLESKNALSLAIIFSEYRVPEGASLFVYNPDKTIVRGAFTSQNNKSDGGFALADFPGSKVIIEYFEPYNAGFNGTVIVGNIGRAYRNIDGTQLKSTLADDNIDISCEEGYEYQLEKHAVARMSFKDGDNGYLCTGALINNTRNDGTLYFLTANHCISSSTVAGTLITYFNYEIENCTGITKTPKSLSGSSLKATNEKSDFTLLLLSEPPTDDYRTYFAGWDVLEDQSFSGGYGIHHPGGNVKKIALTNDSINSWDYSLEWVDNITSDPNTHWLVTFNKGYTEGGSSGSPLFNNEDRIIGQLHGGSEGYDFYGKITTSWNTGVLNNTRLKPFLDPDNTGAKILDGYYPATIVPEAFLYTSFPDICVDAPITLEDGSAFTIDSWNWQFSPSTVQFLDGTNAASQNPVVAFNELGSYDITLKVTNTNGSDSTTRSDYIVSGLTLSPKVKALNDTLAYYCYFNELKFIGTGADSFQWKIISGNELINSKISDDFDTLKILRNDTVNIFSSHSIEVQLTGYHGDCADSVTQTIHLLVADNDSIDNAIELALGENGTFVNYCATAEQNEPYPTIGVCDIQGEWCDCETGGPYVNNSVWFTFTGSANGLIDIDCPGFDNQIAVYDAPSASAIMSGNPSNYTIIAASDDYYDVDGDYAARVINIEVTPGKKYWLQVDGSACGASGEFQVILSDERVSGTELTSKIEDIIKIYPNPVASGFTLTGITNNLKSLAIISMDGTILKDYAIDKFIPESDNYFELPPGILNGLYILRLLDEDGVKSLKITVLK
jgi:PKD repeat protein